MRRQPRRTFVLALSLFSVLLATSCNVAVPDRVALPSFDTASLERLVDDAIAEVGAVGGSTVVELPATLAALLEQHQIDLPPLPSNAAEICDTLGTPGVSSVAGGALGSVIETLASGTDVGLIVGILVAVVFRTCPAWTPHLESALDQILGR